MSETKADNPSDAIDPVVIADIQDSDSPAKDGAKSVWSIRDTKHRRQIQIIAITAVMATFAIAVGFVVQAYRVPAEEQDNSLNPAELFAEACNTLASDPELTTLHARDYAITDKLIEQIKPLTSIDTLIADQGLLSDKSMETIAAMPKLRQLRLRLSPITDEGMATLATCQTLQFLNLPHANCGSKGVEELRELPNLRQLRLGSKKLTGDIARTIAKMTKLRTLHLIGVPITDEDLKVIAAMPQLESLYLDDSAVTEVGWNWLFKNKAHLHVHINQEHHDRDPGRHEHK